MKSGQMRAPLLQKMIPLCPEQYKRFYATSRIPLPKEDRLKTWENSNHIAVIYRSKWFIIRVLRDDCPLNSGEKLHRITAKELEYIFEQIVAQKSSASEFERLLPQLTGAKRVGSIILLRYLVVFLKSHHFHK